MLNLKKLIDERDDAIRATIVEHLIAHPEEIDSLISNSLATLREEGEKMQGPGDRLAWIDALAISTTLMAAMADLAQDRGPEIEKKAEYLRKSILKISLLIRP